MTSRICLVIGTLGFVACRGGVPERMPADDTDDRPMTATPPGPRDGSAGSAGGAGSPSAVDAVGSAGGGGGTSVGADASSGDAALAGADVADREIGPAVMPTKLCPGNVPLCFDFEDGRVPSGWTASGPITVDTTRALGGKYSLHVKTGTNQFVAIRGKPPATPTLYGRYYLYMVGSQPDPHADFFKATGRGPSGEHVWWFGGSSKRFAAGYYPLPFVGEAGTTDPMPRPTIPLDRWTCVEFVFDGAIGTPTKVWQDNQPLEMGRLWSNHSSISARTWGKVDTFSTIEIGLTTPHKIPGYELWMDGVALGSARIGCGAP